MTVWAWVIDGTVVGTHSFDPREAHGDHIDWREAPDDVSVGWTCTDGGFNPPEAPAAHARQMRADLAMRALKASDDIVLRCYEHSLPVPREWIDYRALLRSRLDGQFDDALPRAPTTPEGV